MTPWLIGLGGAWVGVSAYLLGLHRFRRQPAAPTAVAPPTVTAPATVEVVTHDVILDGISECGKTTLMLRLTSPCTTRRELEGYAATPNLQTSRTVPLCFERRRSNDAAATARVHALRFRDPVGEKSQHVVQAIDEAAEARAGLDAASAGKVVALWVWNLAAGADNRTRKWNREHVQDCYGTDRARGLVRHVAVFFNQLDKLRVTVERERELVNEYSDYLRDITDGIVPAGAISFHVGSALDGDGLFDCQGTLMNALGLSEHLRDEPPPRGPS